MFLSKRVLNTQASPIRKLVPYAEMAKKAGKKSIPFKYRSTRHGTTKGFFLKE